MIPDRRLAAIENLARLASERPDFSYGMAHRKLFREVEADEFAAIVSELRAWRSNSMCTHQDGA